MAAAAAAAAAAPAPTETTLTRTFIQPGSSLLSFQRVPNKRASCPSSELDPVSLTKSMGTRTGDFNFKSIFR